MKAVILAAGKGTRLQPLTLDTPKPLISVGGTTIIGWTLKQLSNFKHAINEVILVVGHQKEKIVKWIKNNDLDLSITTLVQEQQLGTAHALLLAKKLLQGEKFLFIYGDILLNSNDWKNFLEQATKTRETEMNLLGVREVEHPERYGVVNTTGDGMVTKIVEKPSRPRSNLISAGMMLLDDTIFQGENALQPSSRGELELPDLINHQLQQGHPYKVVTFKGWWLDVGYPWNLIEANELILQESIPASGNIDPRAKIDENVHIEGPVHVGPNAHIRSGSYIIGPVFIDEGTNIGPNCFIRPTTYIGKHCRIGNAVEIKNSIILNHTNVGHLSYVGDSYIGSNCNFGAGTKVANLRLDSGPVNMIIKGRKMSSGRKKLGIFMGSNVKTGINASLMPGIKLGPNSAIGAHALILKDVPPDTLVYIKPDEEMLSASWPVTKKYE